MQYAYPYDFINKFDCHSCQMCLDLLWGVQIFLGDPCMFQGFMYFSLYMKLVPGVHFGEGGAFYHDMFRRQPYPAPDTRMAFHKKPQYLAYTQKLR